MAAESQYAHLTTKGRRCKNYAAPGRLFCRAHDPDLPTSSKWAEAAEAVRANPEVFGGKERE